jgi:class 3 adenylate cyclase
VVNKHEKKLLALHRKLDSFSGNGFRQERIAVLEKIATIYEKMEDHAEAIDRYLQLLDIAIDLGDRKKIHSVSLKLGRLHLLHRLYPESFNYYLQAEKSAASTISALQARLHGANVLLFKGDLKEAEAIIKSCHSEECPAKSKVIRLRAVQLLAILRNNQKRYDESLYLHQTCIDMLGDSDLDRQMDIRKSMALSLYYQGKRDAAIEMLDSIPASLLESTSKRLRKLIYEIYTACYSENGDYEKAFHYQGLFKDEDHSITQDRVANKLTAIQVNNRLIQVQYEREMFQKRNVELSEKNRVIDLEREKSDNLLLNILPETVANELKERGQVEAKYHDEVTVLFTDFSGFTALAEVLTANELVAEIDACFKGFDLIMDKHGIEKIKTIGDAYMAVSGIPKPRKDHAEAAIRAALEMRNFIDGRPYITVRDGKKARFNVRIGLHTGPVVAGVVGIRKFAYDVWGDTVNTASRMESSGAVGKVNVSQTTYNLTSSLFEFESRGKVSAKGKGEMEMFFVELAVPL